MIRQKPHTVVKGRLTADSAYQDQNPLPGTRSLGDSERVPPTVCVRRRDEKKNPGAVVRIK